MRQWAPDRLSSAAELDTLSSEVLRSASKQGLNKMAKQRNVFEFLRGKSDKIPSLFSSSFVEVDLCSKLHIYLMINVIKKIVQSQLSSAPPTATTTTTTTQSLLISLFNYLIIN